MGFFKAVGSAFGKLIILGVLALAFAAGLIGVVYLSLKGDEVKIPEVVGKDFVESEKELEAMGLKIKRVSTRYSQEKPNTILEQRPSAGEMGKTGLMISVIVAQADPDGKEAPAAVVKKEKEEAETTSDLEIPSDKAKKTNKNSNVKRASTTRDVESTKANKNSNTSVTANGNTATTSNTKANTAVTSPANKQNPAAAPKPNATPASPKPSPAKTPAPAADKTKKTP